MHPPRGVGHFLYTVFQWDSESKTAAKEQDRITAIFRVHFLFYIRILHEYQRKRTETLYQSFSPFMVEHTGFEPVTSTLRTLRATNCANAPCASIMIQQLSEKSNTPFGEKSGRSLTARRGGAQSPYRRSTSASASALPSPSALQRESSRASASSASRARRSSRSAARRGATKVPLPVTA